MRLITKLWATLLLLCVAGVANAATEYEIDQEFKGIAALDGQKFVIVDADGKAVYNSDAQNLKSGTFEEAMAGASCHFVLESLAENADESVHGCYALKAVKADGSNVSFWGNAAVYLNSGKPGEGGFNGCFILGNGTQLGTDFQYGGVWTLEYVEGQGFALKNKGTNGYFVGVTQRPESGAAVYFTFCTLKEKPVTDPLADQKDALSAAIAKGKMINALAYTETTFTALTTATTDGETALAAADATAESLTTATTAINDAIAALALKDGFTSLKDVDFGVFDGWGATAKLTQKLDPTWDLFKATGQSYGDPSVNNRADVSAYDKLYVCFTDGTPRILMNRDVADGQWNEDEAQSHLIDNTKGGWSAKYFSTENGITTVDLKQLVADKGFAHITAIKGANYGNVTITGLYLYKEASVDPDTDVLPIDIQFGTAYNDKSVQNYTSTWTATKDGKTWSLVNFNNNQNGWNSVKCGRKDYTSVASIASPAINAAVKSYVITLDAVSNVNTAKLAIMNGENLVGDSIDITEKFVAGEVVVPVEGQKGYSYVLTIDNKSGKNGSVEISRILLAGATVEPVEPVHIANTAETAYTVAKAIELIDAGEALNDSVFVKGIVSQVDEYNDQYKNINYWISDDGTTQSAQFECFRGKGINGADFAAISDIEVGAEVIVKGILTKYNAIYEFKQYNELVSYKAPFKPLFADGKYYIYNVGTQKYLAAGANWGTHAVVNATGLDYEIKAADGKYTLDSQVSNGGANHFLNGEWNDGAAFGWTIAKVSDGIFTISNGEKFLTAGENGVVTLADDATAEAAQWSMKTLEARIAELATATAEAPVDATFLIQDANFGRNDLRKSAWKMEASNQNLSGGEDNNGTVGNNNAESYHSTFTLSQTLSKAPAGKYKMTAQGFYRQDDSATEDAPVFYANEKTGTFPAKTGSENSMTDAAKSFSAGQYTIDSIDVTVFEDGLLTIGAKGTATHQWVIFDNFRLTYLGNAIDLTEIIASYNKALEDAKAALAAEENAIVTGEERTALTAAIAANENVAQNQDSLTAAFTALNNATSAFTGAKGAYEALTAAKTEKAAMTFAYAAADKKAAAEATLTAEATSAADATAKVEAITKAYRVYAESSALLEGVEGAQNMTDAILNPQAENEVNNWTTVLGEGSGGSIGIRDNEPWTDGADNATHKYFDGGNWGAQAWDVTLEQKIALPAGKYQLTVKSRASADVAFTLFAGEESTTMPAIGASNGLFNRGWNDSSVEFELTEADSIAIGVRGVTSVVHNWMSFSDFRLMQFPAEVEPEPIDPDLVEIPQDQQDQEAGVVTLATFEKDEKTGVTTYTTKDNVCVIFKMKNVDVSNCDYILFKFAEPTPAGLKYAFWTNNKNNDLPAGVTEFKYVFAEDNENEIKDGIIPEVSLLTIFAEAGKVVKVKGVYKHQIPVAPEHTFEGYVAVATTLQGDVQGDVTTAPQTVTLEETETDNVIAVTFSGFSSTIPPVNFSEFTFNATIDADETLTTELYEVAANSKVTGTNGAMDIEYTITGNGSATADSIPTFALKLNQNPMMTINVVFAATADEAKAALLSTTGIINIARDAQKNVIYNVNGQKVNKAQKGLYIINGKKVVNK